MEKSITNNTKIKYTLLSILFSILFIFTALNISTPLTAYADTTTTIGQTVNLGSYSANEDDESSNETAGYLYWAASGDRSGIYYYVVDSYGWVRAHGIILDNAYNNGEHYADYCTKGMYASSKLGTANATSLPSVTYDSNVSPVFYSGGWQSKGSESMAYLTEIVDKIVIKGVEMDCPRWAKLVLRQSGSTVLEELSKPDTKWNVFVEPVSVGYMYTDDTFSEETANTVHTDADFAAGSPKPVGTMNADGSFTPKVYGATANILLSQSVHIDDSGRYRYKFYETQLPFSLCLDHDTDSYIFAAGGSQSILVPVTACDKSVQRLSYIGPHEGIAIASIDITGFTLPPIHTYWKPNGTPGNTEPPSPENATDGPCTIRKLYYTEKIASDGTIIEEATDYHWFETFNTTAYISIDAEEGYEIEGWKASSTSRSLRQKSDYAAVHPIIHSGDSAQEILLDKDSGEKYLYILYKKTEIEENPPTDYDFRLEQSQITKRVTFLESSGPANTASLVTHAFTWTAPAPSKTACYAHGGNGHHLNCSKTWDTAPVE